MEFFTLGHSTRTLEFTVGLLLGYDIGTLVDIRTIPRSAFNPQFNKETFSLNLSSVEIRYIHSAGLGGLRHSRPDSINKGWINSGFRGFADYMQTPEFEIVLDKLIAIGKKSITAFMCSEAVPWRCHRSLVSDALTLRGISVYHIMSRTTASLHVVTPWAHVQGARITYPPARL